MTYTKNIWVDQDVERPKTYDFTNNTDGSVTLTESFGLVTELGTPVNATNMNHIEQGIYDCYSYVDQKITATLQLIFPIGSLYVSTGDTNPLEGLFGTWELVAEGRTLQGADETHEAGTTIEAGLPNITGLFGGVHSTDNAYPYTTGALYNGGSGSGGGYSGTDSHSVKTIGLDASRANSIYGNSNTVQTNAYVVNVWRRTA